MAPIDENLNVTRENVGEVIKRDEFKNLTKEELMMLADAKSDTISDTQESQEVIKKSLEFEEDTFKIDSTNWIEVTQENIKDHPEVYRFTREHPLETTPKIKVNPRGDVIEFLEDKIVNGKISCKKGEQMFLSYDALVREVMKTKNCTPEEAENKYILTEERFINIMQDKPRNSEEYKKFYDEKIMGHNVGQWDEHGLSFGFLGERSTMWLVGHKIVHLYKSGYQIFQDHNARNVGCGARLLKN